MEKEKIIPFSEMIKTKEFQEKFEKLNDMEKRYFDIMSARSGVLYITSKPGIAKSAIMRSIATKLGMNYFDLRLSMLDETDVGLFPALIDIEGKNFLSHVVPEWAGRANSFYTIIHFEELNRASLAVRNAALQLLLERQIGVDFRFNENVLMCASGNLGEEDGCDVEEFDQALNGRLIHMEHVLDVNQWIEYFARENVHPSIVSFINHHAEHYYKVSKDEKHKAYASPRTWTFLSDYITNKFGKNARIQDFLGDVKYIGHCYVGPSSISYIKYCEDTLRISIQDVLNRFPEIKNDLEQFNRDKKSELLGTLKEMKISDLSPKQISNVIDFVLTISEDETIAYLLHVLDNEYNMVDDNDKANLIVENFLRDKRLKKFHNTILKHCDDTEVSTEDVKKDKKNSYK